jgi:UDP-N-acetylmuramate dehydrogenase
MIEQCGWKGKVVGNVGSHKDQALVLVNYGGATGHEIWQLAMDIQQSVQQKFGVTIIPEVNVI